MDPPRNILSLPYSTKMRSEYSFTRQRRSYFGFTIIILIIGSLIDTPKNVQQDRNILSLDQKKIFRFYYYYFNYWILPGIFLLYRTRQKMTLYLRKKRFYTLPRISLRHSSCEKYVGMIWLQVAICIECLTLTLFP